jgi:hypothetical protein
MKISSEVPKVKSGSDYHTATFQGESKTAGLTKDSSLRHQGDLCFPCVGGNFAMGRSLIQRVLL